MKKLKTGLIAGSALGLVSLGIVLADRNIRNKMIESKNQVLYGTK